MEIRRTVDDATGVVTLTLDDGKKNVLGIEAFEAITAAFDENDDAKAIVVAGREGIFSAGLDVKFMANTDRSGMHRLLTAFGRTMMRVWLDPKPTVCAATGHAIAAGTMLAMACDHAVAAEGDYWWGLTETQINFQLPQFAIALARHNLRNDLLEDLLLPGARIDAATAVDAGYADELAAAGDVLARAQAKAAELASLPPAAYAGTKRRLRGMSADATLNGLDDDVAALLADVPVS